MKRLLLSAVISVILLLFVGFNAFAAQQYKLHVLDSLSGNGYNYGYGINSSGDVIGVSYSSSTDKHFSLWNSTGVHDLGITTSGTQRPAINDEGDYVASAYVRNDGITTMLQNPSYPGQTAASLYGINSTGSVTVGSRFIEGTAVTSPNRSQAVYWDSAGVHDIGTLGYGEQSFAYGVNDNMQIVGERSQPGFSPLYSAFLYENGAMKTLTSVTGYGASTAYDINNHGQIVGVSYWPETSWPNFRATVWTNGTPLDIFGNTSADTLARAINDRGQVVGYSFINSDRSTYTAYVWDHGQVTWLQGLGGATTASGISENGWIVGTSYDPTADVYRAVSWEPVPEPSSVTALLVGLCGMGLAYKSRRRALGVH